MGIFDFFNRKEESISPEIEEKEECISPEIMWNIAYYIRNVKEEYEKIIEEKNCEIERLKAYKKIIEEKDHERLKAVIDFMATPPAKEEEELSEE